VHRARRRQRLRLDRLETGAAVAKVARKLAHAFKNSNREFRYDKFFAACGLDSWGELTPHPVSNNIGGK
jgi:hypothetical protein